MELQVTYVCLPFIVDFPTIFSCWKSLVSEIITYVSNLYISRFPHYLLPWNDSYLYDKDMPWLRVNYFRVELLQQNFRIILLQATWNLRKKRTFAVGQDSFLRVTFLTFIKKIDFNKHWLKTEVDIFVRADVYISGRKKSFIILNCFPTF